MTPEVSALDKALAKVCELCPVCLHARYHQQGVVFEFVRNVERDICPFCKAYERVHGKKSHERRQPCRR
ncbi:hypothetical protein KIP69_01355 [Geobacter sulfurreducens]|jgi:hypothetical protein|uniref:Uncharacterized protein n=1 Tax=Geobacter sulfurreducens (strain ATCC 51573 / DSM 12127 / PCA) TaxID=243231 RepID=Q74GI8_GEOSL|nr:hypothetical protein [Geobacter sulfurreducens]AAR33592.1 hypothetical protein GSU0258 [Geobacter sulfurreducens PCA]ADI83093.1 hypothetical protein KN400_0230 [Geobacter sulfurreducens KN400]QVW35528.1 hypothetical protein KIP69_01355 [Geobacter sulfurreducens]UAC04351.1 hypothetical protein KVP06_01285 [Geobacter sulfurreducens]UTG92967.1 hypothetical protein J8622_01150 [Geobacter sulfurreducens]